MQEAFDEETYKTNKPKKYGPALVEMKHLFHEIQDLERMSFAGIPDGDMDIGGHGLILVGVRHENAFALLSRSEDDRDDDAPPPGAADGAGDHIVAEDGDQPPPTNEDVGFGNSYTDVYYLFQNYWPNKALLEVRQDYFFASEGRIGFSNGVNVTPAVDESYSVQTHKVRYAVTSAFLEAPNPRKIKAVWPPNRQSTKEF